MLSQFPFGQNAPRCHSCEFDREKKNEGVVELKGEGKGGDCHNSADAKNKKNNGNRYRSETFFWSFIKAILFSHLSLSLEHMCQVNKKKLQGILDCTPLSHKNVLTISRVPEVTHAVFKLALDP